MTPQNSDQAIQMLYAQCFPDQTVEWDFEHIRKNGLILTWPESFSARGLPLQGALLSYIIGNEAEILSLFVTSDARRTGVATHLMHAFFDNVRKRAVQHVHLEAAKTNISARLLYEKCGFYPVGLRKAYYRKANGARVDALLLKKDLHFSD